MNSLAQNLRRQDASAFFAANCEALFEQDHRILEAFGALNAAIEGGGAFSRVAYIQLAKIFITTQKIIENDRQNGQIDPQKGRGNASVAIDIYLRAPGTPSGGRKYILKRLRISKRWYDFGGPLPLLVICYSDRVESIIRNFSVKGETLKALSADIMQTYAPALQEASRTIEEMASKYCDFDQIQDTLSRVKRSLHA